ncbi:hypothetical protein LWI29_005972 [Acer saccharum]|uniref:Uncharacterized protein n=1 Tax=Acer saccharum TaxID=4024 RepID=A0AA39W0X5_ACESA|nr:hypothetical protein LWI29_005972 [Acer saccharum]
MNDGKHFNDAGVHAVITFAIKQTNDVEKFVLDALHHCNIIHPWDMKIYMSLVEEFDKSFLPTMTDGTVTIGTLSATHNECCCKRLCTLRVDINIFKNERGGGGGVPVLTAAVTDGGGGGGGDGGWPDGVRWPDSGGLSNGRRRWGGRPLDADGGQTGGDVGVTGRWWRAAEHRRWLDGLTYHDSLLIYSNTQRILL